MHFPTPRLLHANPESGGGGGAIEGAPPGVPATPSNPAPSSAPDVPLGTPETPGVPSGTPAPGPASPDSPVSAAPALPDDAPWTAHLAEDIRSAEGLKKFQSPDDLARSYLNLEAMNGTSIRIPGPDASEADRRAFTEKLIKDVPELMYRPPVEDDPEAKDKFLATLGRPQKPEMYVNPEIEGVEQTEHDDTGDFKELAFELGLTNEQYQGLVEAVVENNLAGQHEAEAEFVREVHALKDKWGMAYGDRYRAALDVAAKTGAPEAVIELFKEGTVHPDTLQWLYGLAKQFGGEGSELTLQQGGANIDNAPAEANARIQEILNNKEHPYWKSGHPDNQKALQEMIRLQKIANPQAASDLDSMRKGTLPNFG